MVDKLHSDHSATHVASCATRLFVLAGLFLAFGEGTASAQLQFEHEPINYNTAPASDRIAVLQRKLDAGEVELNYDAEHGYLPALLERLGVPRSSQMLVFSQTSFQLRRISPRRPRAIYYSDDTYVGWVRDGDVIELSSVDPDLGAVFYTLDQREASRVKFVRDRGQCTVCHASSRTQGVPGHLVRSVYPDAEGRPLLGSGTFSTDQRSPFSQRWGGWYVTGTHGQLRHMGNTIARDRGQPEDLDTESGANRTDLKAYFETSAYLEADSDLVALMVLEHQAQMHNFLTLANHETRHALYYDNVMNQALDRPAGTRSETTQRRIAAAAEKLVRYMLFVDEFELSSSVDGVSGFRAQFEHRGPYDARGRSLRQFDLSRRMFKYPCSYLIYSESFKHLPPTVKNEVYRLLFDVLSQREQRAEYAHLSPEDRTAIREILVETMPELREQFKRLQESGTGVSRAR